MLDDLMLYWLTEILGSESKRITEKKKQRKSCVLIHHLALFPKWTFSSFFWSSKKLNVSLDDDDKATRCGRLNNWSFFFLIFTARYLTAGEWLMRSISCRCLLLQQLIARFYHQSWMHHAAGGQSAPTFKWSDFELLHLHRVERRTCNNPPSRSLFKSLETRWWIIRSRTWRRLIKVPAPHLNWFTISALLLLLGDDQCQVIESWKTRSNPLTIQSFFAGDSHWMRHLMKRNFSASRNFLFFFIEIQLMLSACLRFLLFKGALVPCLASIFEVAINKSRFKRASEPGGARRHPSRGRPFRSVDSNLAPGVVNQRVVLFF